MPSTTDFRKTITDPTPLYFAAGVIEKVRSEAPERIAKVRSTDPKALQERVQDVLATIDTDIKKLREQAQHLALQGVGYAAEYAVKAKEGYDSLAEQGKSAVETWRGQDDSDSSHVTYETTIEREPVAVTDEKAEGKAKTEGKAKSGAPAATKTDTSKTDPSKPAAAKPDAAKTAKPSPPAGKAAPTPVDAKKAAAKKAAEKKTAPKSGS